MAIEDAQPRSSMNWIRIWWELFIHPTNATYTRIMGDPKASLTWGVAWMAVSGLVAWLIGPQRATLQGLVITNFGPAANNYFLVFGSLAASISSVLGLLLVSAVAHSLSRLFQGAGTYRQLVFCWGIMPVPFLVFLYWIGYIPWLLRFVGVYSLPRAGIVVSLIYLFIILMVILYLIYSQVVAFSAVEQVGLGKGFGVIIIVGVILGIVGFFASLAYRVILTNIILPYLYTHL